MRILRSVGGLTGCLVTLAGCCVTEVHGIETSNGVPGGSSGAVVTSAGSSSAGSTSAANTGSGSSNGSGSGGTSGTTGTTGTAIAQPPIGLLLDAGAGTTTIFGPVALAAAPRGGSEVARLAYSEGDGGQYGILLQALDSQGLPVGAPLQLAITGDILSDFNGNLSLTPVSPPDVAVADDGTTTTVCWADFSVNPDPREPPVCAMDTAASVRCAAVPDTGGAPDASYANCDAEPRLVFNPSDGESRLFFRAILPDQTNAFVSWQPGRPPEDTVYVTDAGGTFVATPLPGGRDGIVFSKIYLNGVDREPPGLWLAASSPDGGNISTVLLDPQYAPGGHPFTAASVPSAGTAAIFQYDGLHLRALVWSPSDADAGPWIDVPSGEPPQGTVALGICPQGYAYLATTIRGHVLMTEGPFDGGLDTSSSRYLVLSNFDVTPGLTRNDNEEFLQPAMSIATAPTPDGKLLVALSNPWQLGVYLQDCE